MRDTRQEILHFWFKETEPVQWFQKNSDFDQLIRDRFLVPYKMAKEGLSDDWQYEADGCLALCILLDQFPRNMFRDTPQAFESDEKALRVAKFCIKQGFDQVLSPVKRRFIYLPFEHSEDIAEQEKSLKYFESIKKDDPMGYEYAVRHYDVIKEFGRFPHRNAVLGRPNTDAEEEYLAQPNAGF